jgi:hypothetical protein
MKTNTYQIASCAEYMADFAAFGAANFVTS